MKRIWIAIVSACSTFSVFPTPRISWDRVTLSGTLAALPLVGALIGGVGLLYHWIAALLGLPMILSAVVLTVLPVLLSGGIHMDGFADTVDALSSHAEPEKKRAILKDPHAGAFAVIGVGCYLLLYFGLCAALPLSWTSVGLLGLTHVLARASGALLGTVVPSAHEGMLKTFHDAANRASAWVLGAWIALALLGAAVLSPLAAGTFAAAGAGVFFYVKHTANRQFCGMSGDLAGYCITLSELLMLLGLVLSERMATLWF